MIRVLVVYYSQTGQLERVVRSVSAPLENADSIEVDYWELQPAEPYPFPWSFGRIIDAFPESVLLIPPPLRSPSIRDMTKYDLVVLGYTVWYLSPCPPVVSFLTSELGRQAISNKPVITVVGCRDMWLIAQQTIRRLLGQANARLIDNIALVDQGAGMSSFITTPRWMLTGRKDPAWGILPQAGISESDIRACRRFGTAIVDACQSAETPFDGPMLTGLGAVKVDQALLVQERVGHRSLLLMGYLARSAGALGAFWRRGVVLLSVLIFALMVALFLPLSRLAIILLRPLIGRWLRQQREHFEAPSGSATDRMRTDLR